MKWRVLFSAYPIFQVSFLFAQVPRDGLLFHYPLDGNINDASGNSEDGYAEYLTLGLDRFGNNNGVYFNQYGNLSRIVNQSLYNAPDGIIHGGPGLNSIITTIGSPVATQMKVRTSPNFHQSG